MSKCTSPFNCLSTQFTLEAPTTTVTADLLANSFYIIRIPTLVQALTCWGIYQLVFSWAAKLLKLLLAWNIVSILNYIFKYSSLLTTIIEQMKQTKVDEILAERKIYCEISLMTLNIHNICIPWKRNYCKRCCNVWVEKLHFFV